MKTLCCPSLNKKVDKFFGLGYSKLLEHLENLNLAQSNAVLHPEGPCLILAGAGPGPGKPRVLIYWICHLLFEHRVDPRQIFAVTFTNKAAVKCGIEFVSS